MNRILTLPLCTKYSKQDVEYVVDAVKYVYENRSAHISK
jgi:dTDP-4-amino-4,6-dideoxygalactose transaminase